MKQYTLLFLCFLLLFLAACSPAESIQETISPETTVPATTTVPTTEPIPVEVTVPVTVPAKPVFLPTIQEPAISLTDEEKNILLKLGMAERGQENCTECIALVMCTVLNRVTTGWYSCIRSAVYSPDQFSTVTNGAYAAAKPSLLCYDALEMVLYGWDESQGALYYEWCKGESWHSKNRHLLFQHCDIRFYD